MSTPAKRRATTLPTLGLLDAAMLPPVARGGAQSQFGEQAVFGGDAIEQRHAAVAQRSDPLLARYAGRALAVVALLHFHPVMPRFFSSKS
jgi:hypothetical protein